MSTIIRTDRDLGESPPKTLGDLLYSSRAKLIVPESEWRELVRAVAGGDQAALYSLYGRMHRLVFTSVLRMVKSHETAEELTVDVFHQVWRRAGRYDPADGTVVGWIMNQARSRAIDRLRSEQRQKRTNPHPQDAEQPALAENSSEEAISEKERQHLLRRALAVLTQGEREAIETAFLSEYTYVETAARLSQPVGTVKTRIRSGLAKLREALVIESKPP